MSGAVKRVGIGIADDAQKVIESATGVRGNFVTVCYCQPGTADIKTTQ